MNQRKKQTDKHWHEQPGYLFNDRDLPARPTRSARPVLGNGRLAQLKDLAGVLGVPNDPESQSLTFQDTSVLLEADPRGSQLRAMTGQTLTLDQSIRERHLLVTGVTGGGKTMRVLLPLLAHEIACANRTVIALDAKGGLLHPYLTALARQYRPGEQVHCINFKDPTRNTGVWNPVHGLKTRSEALAIAQAVCVGVNNAVTAGGMNEAFWLFSSVNLLSDILLALAETPGGEVSLSAAKTLVDATDYTIAGFADQHPKAKQFSERYPAIVRMLNGSGHQTQQSVIADLAMRLELFSDENIIRTTSGPSELDLTNIIGSGGMLVIDVPEASAQQLLPLTTLLISRTLGHITDESARHADGRLPLPCTLVLDEFGSACGRLPEFETRLATLRSRGVTVLAAVQTISQIDNLYEKAAESVLENFATKIFLGGALSLADSRRASEMSGQCTIDSVAVSVSGAPGRRRKTRIRTPTARPVLLPDEVSRPPVNPVLGAPATVFLPGKPPLLAYFAPAFELPVSAMALRSATAQNKQSKCDR
jgi:type IV secretion system protein VirD4